MSNFEWRAVHPKTGKVENCEFLDDFFGRHLYGVRFSDGDVFCEDEVESVEEAVSETKTAFKLEAENRRLRDVLTKVERELDRSCNIIREVLTDD
jgi:hypothetical protein